MLATMSRLAWPTIISPRDIGVGLGLLFVYLVSLAVYRLYLGPLAQFPGRRLAACTLWYEFYYDVVKLGGYTWKIGEMHKKYGRLPRVAWTLSF